MYASIFLQKKSIIADNTEIPKLTKAAGKNNTPTLKMEAYVPPKRW
jgi:hypothetical protein